MKTYVNLIFLIVILLTLACIQETKKSMPDCCLDSKDSLLIINGIMKTTDDYAEANRKMDIDKCADFFDSSPDFMFAETGKEYLKWDSIYVDIKNWYSQPLDTVQFNWEERSINPLNHNTATLYGTVSFRAKFKSGLVYESRATIASLLTKKNEQWKTTIGYWSLKILSN